MKCLIVLAVFALLSSVFAGDITINNDQSTVDQACGYTHSDLTTQFPASLIIADSGMLSLDTFTLELKVSRLYYLAHANMSDAHGDSCSDAFVMSPIAGDNCNVHLTATMSWGDARNLCGVYRDDSSTTSMTYTFRGSILLDLTEKNLPFIRDRHDLTRLVHSVHPFEIKFKRTASTSHTITTFFPVTLEAAIIRQFDVRTPDAVTTAHSFIRLFTSVQYPFVLTNPLWHGAVPGDNMVLEPIAQTTAYLLSGEDCLDSAADTVCEQEWLIQFDAPLSPPKCDFTGQYNINFTVRCSASIGAGCPLPLNADGFKEQNGEVVMHITTEYFCPQIFANVIATASLASYQDAAHSIAKDDFLSGDTIYFRATSASATATISSTTLASLSIVYTYPGSPQSTTLLYPLANSIVVSGATDHDDYHCWFSVPLDSTFPVPFDGSVSFQFQATLNIVFQNTQAQEVIRVESISPRVFAEATPSANGNIDAISTVSIAGPTSPVVAGSSSGMATNTLIYIIAGSCVGVILFATIAVILRRRNVAAKKTTSGTEMAGVSAAVTGATTVV